LPESCIINIKYLLWYSVFLIDLKKTDFDRYNGFLF
jgi:hypothetical protein